MVSIWPWKSDASAADFEKKLSALAAKIQRGNARHDKLRQSSRKVKVVWTLYAGFAYMLAAVILTLVTGWQTWSVVEYIAVVGGPFLIYGIRKGLTAYYEYRISSTQAYLENLNKERESTIEKLKTATKYTSTQELLQKYGSEKPSPKKEAAASGGKRKSNVGLQQQQSPPHQRTNIAPPPTANIVRPPIGGPFPNPSTPQRVVSPVTLPPGIQQPSPPQAGADFAPNAFAAPSTYSSEPHWYDRLFDVLLGEDEASAKNRIALICQSCKLVNGQAPPGTKTLEDLGRWRCGGCGSWNGVETEATKIVKQIKQQEQQENLQPQIPAITVSEVSTRDEVARSDYDSARDNDASESEDVDGHGSEGSSAEAVEELEESPPSRETRSKAKQRKKYQWNKDML